jgi:hypothetical protein
MMKIGIVAGIAAAEITQTAVEAKKHDLADKLISSNFSYC